MKVSLIFLDSSAVEHSAVNRRVVGSNPTRGVENCKRLLTVFFICIIVKTSTHLILNLIINLVVNKYKNSLTDIFSVKKATNIC